jgi:hypothetical protein
MSYVKLARVAGFTGMATALLVLGAVVSTAHAGSAGKHRASAGQAAGGSWSRSTQVQRTATGHTRQDQWTSEKGKTASRRVVVNNDAASGTRNRNAVRTGPEGRSTTVDTVTQRTDTGYTRGTTATRDDGTTATRNTTVVNDRTAGTRAVDSTATGFNGRTSTYSSDAQRTDDGYTREVTRTLPDGAVKERSFDVSCDKAAQSCVKTVTGGG